MAIYGGLPPWVAVLDQRARSSPTWRSFPAIFALVVRRLVVAHRRRGR